MTINEHCFFIDSEWKIFVLVRFDTLLPPLKARQQCIGPHITGRERGHMHTQILSKAWSAKHRPPLFFQ